MVNNFIVQNLIGLKNIKDTQCGFKLFSRLAAHKIFFNMHLVRWAFDVEMLYIAQESSILIKEIPVSYEDVAGSKLNVFEASISFLRDFLAMLTFYNTGYWNIN
jgi:dolichyl-phosphate beta-glucosyltransferase